MAPSFDEPVQVEYRQKLPWTIKGEHPWPKTYEREQLLHKHGLLDQSLADFYEPGRTVVANHDKYEHDDLRPRFPNVHWEPLTEVPYQDKGLQGDPKFRDLLANATDVFDYTP